MRYIGLVDGRYDEVYEADCTLAERPVGWGFVVVAHGVAVLSYGWQYDAELWAQVPADLRDSNAWNSVGFVENEAVLVPARQSGLYFVCTSPVGRRRLSEYRDNDLFSILLTPIYIGKTGNLRRRFLEHCRSPSVKLEAARRCFGASMQFWYHRRGAERLGADEAILIRCFGPIANDQPGSISGAIGDPVAIGVHDR